MGSCGLVLARPKDEVDEVRALVVCSDGFRSEDVLNGLSVPEQASSADEADVGRRWGCRVEG